MGNALLQPVDGIATSTQTYFINQQNARELQRRSVEAKNRKKLADKLAADPQFVDPANTPRLARVEAELARVAILMSKTTDASDYHKLANARGTLFKEWQVLSGTPNPGSAKSKRPAKPAMIQPEPIPDAKPAQS